MNYINKFINNPDIFNSNNKNQQLLFERALKDLTNYHKNKCSEYANFVKKINFKRKNYNQFYSLPFLPVQIFKLRELKASRKIKYSKLYLRLEHLLVKNQKFT